MVVTIGKNRIFAANLCTWLVHDMPCSNGGMVDTKDLKSFGYCSCAGSSPASSTLHITIIV